MKTYCEICSDSGIGLEVENVLGKWVCLDCIEKINSFDVPPSIHEVKGFLEYALEHNSLETTIQMGTDAYGYELTIKALKQLRVN